MESLSAPRLYGVSLLQIMNVLSYVIFLFTSGISGAGIWGLPRIGETSNQLPVNATPAGYAFSIWSLIFILLGVMTFLQVLPRNREWSSKSLGLWWVLNAALGEGLWPFAFIFRWGSMWISAILLLFIVFTAAAMYVQMGAGTPPLHNALSTPSPSTAKGLVGYLSRPTPAVTIVETLMVQGGVAIYLGWTTCASILNVSIALSKAGVSESEGALGSILVCTAAAILATVFAITRTEFLFGGAVCWALAAIHVNQKNLGLPTAAANASLVCAGVAGVAGALALLWRVGMIFTGRLTFAPMSLTLGGEAAPKQSASTDVKEVLNPAAVGLQGGSGSTSSAVVAWA